MKAIHKPFILIVSVAYLSFPAQAQNKPTITSTPDKATQPIEVIVCASRGNEQDPLDVPQSVNLITAQDLNETVYNNLEDALHRLPNINLNQASQRFSTRQTGGNTSSNYWQEGFSIRGLGGPRVLVLTDGVRQAGQGIGYGGGNLALYDLYSIEKVEVLRGPASVIYGTDALGGVVSITTREPKHCDRPQTHGQAMSLYDGSRNLWRIGGLFEANGPLFAMVMGSSYTQASIPHAAKGTTVNGGSYTTYGGWVKTDYRLTPNVSWRLIANSTQVQDVLIADRLPIDGLPGFAPYLHITLPMYQRNELGTEWIGRHLSHIVEEGKLGIYWQGIKRHMDWQTPQGVFGGPQAGYYKILQETNDQANTFEIQPSVRLGLGDHTLLVGADGGYDQVRLWEQETKTYSTTLSGMLPTSPIAPQTLDRQKARAHQIRIGVYAQDRWDLHPFELTLGGRFDAFHVHNNITGTNKNPMGLSGSASSLYHLNESTSCYITLANGFRVPDLGERFQESTVVIVHPVRVKGNPDLSAERAYSIEVGTKHRSEWFTAEGAIFANQVHNYIGLQPVNQFTWQYANLGKVLLYGLEGQISFRPFEPLELYVGGGRTFSHQYKLIAIPDWNLNFGASYTYPTDHSIITEVKPEINGLAASSSYDSLNAVHYPGYVVFDLQVSVGLHIHPNLMGRWIIGIKNVFDKAYYTPFFGNPTKDLNAQCGRGFFTSLELKF